jgi:hypothetical protein
VRHLSLLMALWIPASAQVAPMLNLVVIEAGSIRINHRPRHSLDPGYAQQPAGAAGRIGHVCASLVQDQVQVPAEGIC